MLICAGCMNKKNLITVVACLLLSVCLTVLLAGSELLDVKKNNDEIRVEYWEYAWVNKPGDFNASENEWKKTSNGEIKSQNNNDYKYLHLRTEVENGGTTKILSIRSGNNLLNADVDGERVFEQLETGALYSGTSNVEIVLEPTGQIHKIDLYLYAPSVLRFSAFIKNAASINLRDTTGILLGAILLGASIGLLLIKKDSAHKKYFVLIAVSCLIIAYCAIIGQSGLYIRQFSPPIFYRILILFLMITAIGMQYIALEAINAQGKANWILYVSALFPVSFLISPNHSITQFIFVLYGIWSAAYVFIYMAVLILQGVPSDIGSRVVIIAFLSEATLQSLFWLSHIIPFKVTYLQSYLIAAGASLVAAAVVRMNALKANKTVVTSENPDKIYKQITDFLFEKADTNKGHLKKVSEYVKIICRQLKMSESTIKMAAEAALLHDIGKIALPKFILEKEETVDKDEYEQLRSHVLHGYNILIEPDNEFMLTAARIAMHHHERYDGSGYLGMKGNEIDLFSRITSIADTFDALTSYRAYKKTWSFDEAYDYINTHAGDYFDPELVKVFNACRNEILEIYLKNNQLSQINEPVNES